MILEDEGYSMWPLVFIGKEIDMHPLGVWTDDKNLFVLVTLQGEHVNVDDPGKRWAC